MSSLKDVSSAQQGEINGDKIHSEPKSPASSTAAQMGDDSSEPEAILDKAKSHTSIRTEDNTQTDSMPVTTSNLGKLEREQEMLWADAATATMERQEHTKRIREGAMALGVDITSSIYNDMEKSLDGLTPMERFIDGKNKS